MRLITSKTSSVKKLAISSEQLAVQVSPPATIFIMRPKAATYQPSSGGDFPVDGRRWPSGRVMDRSM